MEVVGCRRWRRGRRCRWCHSGRRRVGGCNGWRRCRCWCWCRWLHACAETEALSSAAVATTRPNERATAGVTNESGVTGGGAKCVGATTGELDPAHQLCARTSRRQRKHHEHRQSDPLHDDGIGKIDERIKVIGGYLPTSSHAPHGPQAREQQRCTNKDCVAVGHRRRGIALGTHTTVAERTAALSTVVAWVGVWQVVRSWRHGGCGRGGRRCGSSGCRGGS